MLKNIDNLLSADLLHALQSMGHGDEIAIVDANFPAARYARRLIRVDGADATQVVRAILSVLPLDTYDDVPACRMQVVGDADHVPDIATEFQAIISASVDGACKLGSLERHAFYERVGGAFAVVTTSERRLYGNLILVKGVL